MDTEALPRERTRWPGARGLAGGVVLIAVLALLVWQARRLAWGHALQEAEATGRQRLLLYAGSIEGELDKYRPLPVILGRDRDILELLNSPGDSALVARVNRRLEKIQGVTRASTLYILTPQGVAIAASNWNLPDSFVGRSFAYRPYYQQAVAAGTGQFFAMGTTSLKPGYYMASAVRDHDRLIGVVVVKVDLQPLERAWAAAGEIALVADANQIAFLASRAELRYAMLAPLAPEAHAAIDRNLQYPPSALRSLDYAVVRRLAPDAWIVRVHARGVPEDLLMQSRAMPSEDWTISYLTDLARVGALGRDTAVKVSVALASALLLLLYIRQRRFAMRAILAARDGVADTLRRARNELEAQVRAQTTDLRVEIAERQRAEQVLREAQSELVHAGKMAVLGQMSAVVAHELNQPLTAMRTFLASTRVFLERGETDQVEKNLRLVEDIGQQMARITGQLRQFSLKRESRIECVPLAPCIERALLLVGGRLQHERVEVDVRVPVGAAVLAEGTRIDQVVLNLVRNALDAMADCDPRRLSIGVTVDRERCALRIADTGEGIADEHFARLFEPFYTTKSEAGGLGLGLSVTYEIVRAFGGTIRVESVLGSGSTFVVELPKPEEAHA